MTGKFCPGRFDLEIEQSLKRDNYPETPYVYKCLVCGTLQHAELCGGAWRPRDHYKSGAWRVVKEL